MKYVLILMLVLVTLSFTQLVDGALLATTEYTVERSDSANALYNFEFSPDGRNAYFMYGPLDYDSTIQTILVHYTMATPFDIDNRVQIHEFAVPHRGFAYDNAFSYTYKISNDGRFLYIFSFSDNRVANGDELIYKYELTTPFALSSMNLVDTINYRTTGNYHILHVDFSPDGRTMYAASYYTNHLSEYRLSSPFELSFDNLVTVVDTQETFLVVQVAHDGSRIFVDDFPHIFRNYQLAIPFQLSSVGDGLNITPQIVNLNSDFFVSDFGWFDNGLELFIKTSSSTQLYRYTFDTPYNIEDVPRQANTTPRSISNPPVINNNPQNERSEFILINNEQQGSGGCSGDCTYPTIGLDKHQRRLVDNGFSYNDNTVNVVDYHTPYPLIETETHKVNEMKIKAWDNNTIRLIQIGLGMPEIGKPTNEAEVLLEVWFEPYNNPQIEKLLFIDKDNLLKHPLVSAKSKMVDCRADNDEQCVSLTFNYVYDKIPKYNVVKVDVMDFARNVQSTTFNDGIELFGTVINDSPKNMMVTNIPANHPEKYAVDISKVSNTNDLWIDKYGYHWMGDESKIQLVEDIQFIRHQDKQSNFGSNDRNNSNFEKIMQYEKQHAQKILEELYEYQTEN